MSNRRLLISEAVHALSEVKAKFKDYKMTKQQADKESERERKRASERASEKGASYGRPNRASEEERREPGTG